METKDQKDLLRDFRLVSDKPKAKPTDIFTGKKVCTRFSIPASFISPDPLNPKAGKLNLQMGNCDCLGSRCSLWNPEAVECHEVTAFKATASHADHLAKLAYWAEMIDGQMRVPHSKD